MASRRLTAAALAAALLAAACTSAGPSASPPAVNASASPAAGASGDPAAGSTCDVSNLPGWPAPGQVPAGGFVPVLASSEKIVGPDTRLLFALVDAQGKPIADASLKVQIAFYDLCASPATPTQTVTPLFAWGIVNQRAFYVARAALGHAGAWGAVVTTTDGSGQTQTARIQFSVDPSGPVLPVGAQAPSVRTPVLADVGGDVHQISSDPNPNPDFYKLSIDQALAQHLPFVLVFATPAFCQSGQCGPTLDTVKAAVKARAITTINVEPYQLQYANGRLQPVLDNGNFVPVKATDAYGLQTEPFIFVIDGKGTIVDEFEAVVAPQELDAAITRALAGS